MHRSDNLADHIYIVGCGGVASWLLPPLLKLLNPLKTPPVLILIDGDKLEKKNLDRQLFDESMIGEFKATALANKYNAEGYRGSIVALNEWLFPETPVNPNALFLGCADNHTARRNILGLVDSYGGRAIVGGNEYTDAEAFVYDPQWKGGPLDPRVYYPDILTDTANDPSRPSSCQGIAAVQTPQLVLANVSAANHMLWLFWFHHFERPTMNREETFNTWPIRHTNTFSRFATTLVGQQQRETPKTTTPQVIKV